MTICDQCRFGHTKDKCPRCGAPNPTEDSGNLDQLIQRNSVPSLATLFKRAKEAGVIGAVSVYGEGSTGS